MLGTIIHQRKWNAKLWYNTGKRTFIKWWDLMDPSPPEQCPCGNVTEDHCSELGLRNHHNFPPFCHLPDYHLALPLGYYQEVEGSFYCRPVRHWALVGEIEENLTDPIRPRVVFKSKFGERFMVNFHFDNRWEPPTFFNWNQMTNGSTMCILYALQKTFMDLNKGVRVEDQGACMVFPTSLPILSDECENLIRAKVAKNETCVCFFCKSQANHKDVICCPHCKLAYYCSTECQANHWKASHKNLCKHFKMLDQFMQLDFHEFNGFVDWNFEKYT